MTSDDRTEGAHPPDAVPGDQPQPSNQTIDAQVRSVPLDQDEGPDRVVSQESAGEESVAGGGESPDPDAPAQGPAPGTVEGASEEIEARRGDGRPSFKAALEEDRVAGGSSSLPEEDAEG